MNAAETLRRTAALIRRNHEDEFFLAVADWLDATYAEHEEIGVMRAVTPSQIAARAVARTYLGEAS